MTRLYIDEREIPAPVSSDASLGNLLKQIERRFPPDSAARCNAAGGRPPAAGKIENDSIKEGTPGESGRIEVCAAALSETAADTIREAVEYLERMEAALPALIEDFRGRPGAAAFRQLEQLYEGFYWMNTLLDRLTASFPVSLEELRAGGGSGRMLYRKMISVLKEIILSHEEGDFPTIADLLEYAILPMAPQLRELFAAIRERIAAGR